MGSARARGRCLFGDLALVIFLLAQVSDGVLTFVGVTTLGPTVEGNPVITWLMSAAGTGAGLMIAKLAAGCFGIVLHLSEVHKAVAALACFYLVVAVVPWLGLLFG